MSFYKMVEDRVELARRLEALLDENAETMARAVAAFFAPISEAFPEEVWYEDELLRQRLLVRLVARLRRAMVDAATDHHAEMGRLDALREERDRKLGELYGALVEIRRQARLFYPDRAASILGLRGRTNRRPLLLARQARLAVDCLAKPLDGAQASSDVDVARRRYWLRTLQPLAAGIGPVIEAVARGRASTIGTLKAKTETMKDFDLHFGRVGRYAKSAYELVGLDELAARVPPRVARKDRRKSSRPSRRPEKPASLPRERLFDHLANVVDLGRWVKQRLLGSKAGLLRRRA